jgi:hypothetical protein
MILSSTVICQRGIFFVVGELFFRLHKVLADFLLIPNSLCLHTASKRIAEYSYNSKLRTFLLRRSPPSLSRSVRRFFCSQPYVAGTSKESLFQNRVCTERHTHIHKRTLLSSFKRIVLVTKLGALVCSFSNVAVKEALQPVHQTKRLSSSLSCGATLCSPPNQSLF